MRYLKLNCLLIIESPPFLSEPDVNLHHGIHQSVFMSAMAPNPAKDLSLCWEQHSKLLPGLDKVNIQDDFTAVNELKSP